VGEEIMEAQEEAVGSSLRKPKIEKEDYSKAIASCTRSIVTGTRRTI